MTALFWIVIAIVLAQFAWDVILTALNVKASKRPVPDLLSGLYDEDKYRKQQEYSSVRRRLGVISTSAGTLFILAMFCFGGFSWMDSLARIFSSSPVVIALIFFLLYHIITTLIDLPFGIWSTFVIEQRFGFNRTTPKMFALDQLKGFLLSVVLMGLLLGLCVFIYLKMPDWFWLLAWGVMSVITLFLQYFYSQLIVPLFNRQTPLEPGELRTAIEEFARKADFRIKDIYVMDSSKRSTHANAYFTGFGHNKRVVLYDTLLKQIDTQEIVGVLAHEIGHNKRHHTLVSLAMSLITSLVMFYIFGLVIDSQALAEAAGCSQPSFHVNLVVFSMLYAPINILLDIVMNVISRRHERQADAFAKEHGYGPAVASALKKMSAASLSNLTPHPVVVFTEYSHPTLYERVRDLTS